MTTDIEVQNLVINKLSKSQMEQLINDDNVNDNEIYITDEETYTKEEIDTKINKIQVSGGGVVYTAGENITISDENVIDTKTKFKGIYDKTQVYYPGDVVRDGTSWTNNTYMCILQTDGQTYQLNSTYYFVKINPEKYTPLSTRTDTIYLVGSSVTGLGVNTNDAYTGTRLVTGATPDNQQEQNKTPYFNGTTGEMHVPGGIDGYYTKNEIDSKITKSLTYNHTIDTGAWTQRINYSGNYIYGVSAALWVSEAITKYNNAYVTFNENDASSGNFSPVFEWEQEEDTLPRIYIKIYAKEIPDHSVNLTITFIP